MTTSLILWSWPALGALLALMHPREASAATLRYSSYLGGSQYDGAYAVAVDAAGNAYVAGSTDSSDDFPLRDAFQPVLQGVCPRRCMKIVGTRRRTDEPAGVTPEDALRRAAVLQRQANLLNPFPRPRGFVFKARTWEEYARWRRAQTDPRLW